jgi:hypothetical protein
MRAPFARPLCLAQCAGQFSKLQIQFRDSAVTITQAGVEFAFAVARPSSELIGDSIAEFNSDLQPTGLVVGIEGSYRWQPDCQVTDFD